MRYVYKRLDDLCRHFQEYDGHAVHGLVRPCGEIISATFIHRRGKGVKTLGNDTVAESGGGIRFEPPEAHENAVLVDGMRLTTAMSRKSVALFGDSPLALGGGKTVISTRNAPHLLGSEVARKEFWRIFGQEIMHRIGTYLTAEDMGTSVEDLAYLAEYSPRGLVTGHTHASNPSPVTARGVIIGMEEAVLEAAGAEENIYDRRFLVQGLGGVGSTVLNILWRNKSKETKIIVTDKKEGRITEALRDKTGIEVLDYREAEAKDADVFMPCAEGGILNERTIPNMKFSVVVGCANNQLATREDGKRLYEAGIFYVPDYYVNAGGLAMVVCSAITGGDVYELLERMRCNLRHVFDESSRENIATSIVADRMTEKYVNMLRPATA